jgi:hypothetical protein
MWCYSSDKPKAQKDTAMKKKVMAPVRLTDHQMDWVEKESLRTGDSMASVIRKLIQEKVEEKK